MIRYLARRLRERSTWGAIGAAIPAAALLAAPWSYAAIAVAAIVALCPSPPKKDGCED
ncbi:MULTISPECIES: hypothetical protein [unclassified Sphingomonas]|uniref:hypothetical protein n=1 Tax=unclassified Sphingomonas TaxID=196159 RepID=UPI000A6ECCDE|nr:MULTISPECIES: hypothetical protein [unclassified Sphingomonas]